MFGKAENLRVAAYRRVSSEEQTEGYSLDAQTEIIQDFAKRRNWTIVADYSDPGRSGKTDLRPGFQQMIADAEAGKFDAVVVHKLDRFSRSLLDMLLYLRRLEIAGVSLVSATEDFDFSTPIGRVLLALLAAFAQWYLDNLSAETRKGKKQRAMSGGYNGHPGTGYTNLRMLRRDLIALGDAFREGKLGQEAYSRKADALEAAIERWQGQAYETQAIPNPENAEAIVVGFNLYATGHFSDADVAHELNLRGYKTNGPHGKNPFTKDTVRDILQNERYYGMTKYKGALLAGDHEPLISKELFDQVQLVRKQRRERHVRNDSDARPTVNSYPLTGLLYCPECGCKYIGWHLRDERRYRDTYRQYSKQCHQQAKSAPAAHIEAVIDRLVMSLTLPHDWQQRALEHIETTRPKSDALAVYKDSLRGQLDRYKRLYVNGDVTWEEYSAERDRLDDLLTRAENHSAAHPGMYDLERAAELLSNVQALWGQAPLEKKGAVLQHLFEKIWMHEGHIVAIEPKPLLWHLL